jgi:hypothetical protein
MTGGLGGELNFPQGVATDAAGDVYVADNTNQRVQEFDSSGNWLRAWGLGVNGGSAFGICTVAASCQAGLTGGGLGGEFAYPQGIGTDAAGDVYLADFGNARIQKFHDPVLKVSLTGTGSGTVTGSGITCPGTCSQGYISGTGVALTATAASGSTFMGWSGACSGTGTCSVAMSSDQAVTAAFTRNPLMAGAPYGTKINKVNINEKKQTVTLRFTAAGTVTGFQCELIKPKEKGKTAPKPKFTPCSSPKTYKHLKPGRYTFKVRAVNSAGPDPRPAVKKFKL